MALGIRRVAVIGAGVMGQGIAQLAAQSGHMTLLYDVAPEAVERALTGIAAALERRVDKGKLSASDARQIQSRIRGIAALDSLADADVVIEAVVERLDVKHDLLRRLEALCPAETLLCSNTSSLSITGIAAVARHPERVAGLHFFNPALVMKLVEVVRGERTDADVIEQLVAFARGLGKTPVQVNDSPGFIVNRCARPYYSEALVMLEQGVADVATLDACLTANAGMPLGPFELMDLIGLDVGLSATETIWRAFDRHPRFAPSKVVGGKVARGELGRKSDQGFYRYPREPSAEAAAPKMGSANELARWLAEQLSVPVLIGDGRLASERAESAGTGVLVLDQSLVDWPRQGVMLAYTQAGLDSERAAAAERLALSLGIVLKAVPDTSGLVVQRMVAMLYDEAQRAADAGVAEPAAIDTALCNGLNFRQGPFALARAVGEETIERIWRRLASVGPAGRYRDAATT